MRLSVHLLIASAVLIVSGCAQGPEYRVKANFTYERLALSRPKGASTYSVIRIGNEDAGSLSIPGMSQVARDGDLVITLDVGKPVLKGPVHQGTSCIVATALPDPLTPGAWSYGTCAGTNKALGAPTSEVYFGPVYAISYHAYSGGISMDAVCVATERSSSKEVIRKDLSASIPISTGSLAPGAFASFGRGPGESEQMARQKAGSGGELRMLAGSGRWLPRSTLAVETPSGTAQDKRARQAWDAEASRAMNGASEQLMPALNRDFANLLNEQFGSGSATGVFDIGMMPDDPGWQKAAQLILATAQAPLGDRATACDEALGQLRILARPAEPNPRAMPLSLYDQAVVLLIANRIELAMSAAQEASRFNSAEKDGMFTSHGRTLEWKIAAVQRHLADRIARERNSH